MSKETQPVSEEIKQRIVEFASSVTDIVGRRTALIQGGVYGYYLASSKISTLEQTIIDYDKQILEQKGEIERLKKLIKKEFEKGCFMETQHDRNESMRAWEKFKAKHNI